MKRSTPILLALLWPAIGGAADISSLPAPMPAASPELRAYANGIKDAAHARDLGLRRMDVSVDIRGAVSETTVEATFANPTNEILEGDFRFLLPPGAVITGYALDVNEHLIDGVLVDRPRARAVYNERVRRGIDPGVAEVTPDNMFSTSVYPVRPGRGRTIRLRFAMPIPLDGYHLPLAIGAPSEGWSVAVHASGIETPPTVQLPGSQPVRWTRDTAGYTTRIERESSALAGDLVIARPDTPDAVASEHRTGERDIQLGGFLPASTATTREERLRVYWDRSHSRLASDTAAEIAVVRQAIDRLHPASVELVAFNSSGAERTSVTSGQAAAAWLSALHYRGATSYAALAGDGPTDHCLLFANGGPTIDRATGFDPHCRLDAVSSSAGADQDWLRHAALAHGGVALPLHADDQARVIDAITNPRPGVVAVSDQDGRPLPFIPLDARAGRWLLLARLPAGGALTVHLAGPGGETQVQAPGTAVAERFDAVAALIARDQLATLGATEQRDAFVETSRRYGIASPSLSFVVLETPADYMAARIDPPPGYPADARSDYLRLRKEADAHRVDDRRNWLEQVVTRWTDTVGWWNKRYDPQARPARVATSTSFDRTAPGGSGAQADVSDAVMAPPPSPAMAPPPPPVPEAQEMREAALPSPPMPMAMPRNQRAMVMGAASGMASAAPASSAKASSEEPAQTSTIQIDAWQPDRPYLELYDGRPADFDARFLEAQKKHGQLPIFYLDTAEWLRRHGRPAEAPEMVLFALDLPTANEVTLGIVADRLERYGEIDRAVELRERQMVLDPDRPQPRRLLALALARRAKLRPETARADLERAIGLLYAVATTPLDGPWDGIEMISLDEANALLPRLKELGGTVAMDPRLVKLLDVDVRVVIDWTTEGSDMDLWVDEPNGERAIYNNPRTVIGGHLSHDMTRGYGPEEYMLRRAPSGTYTVQANVFAPDRLDPNGATLLTAHVFRNYGRPDEHEESIDVEVKRDDTGAKKIGQIVVTGGDKSAPEGVRDRARVQR